MSSDILVPNHAQTGSNLPPRRFRCSSAEKARGKLYLHIGWGLMRTLRTIVASALLAATTYVSPLLAQTEASHSAASCAPANGWNLICGNQNPEDLVPIPGTRWIIASGMKEGSGIKLVDTAAKTARPFYTGQHENQRPVYMMFVFLG